MGRPKRPHKRTRNGKSFMAGRGKRVYATFRVVPRVNEYSLRFDKEDDRCSSFEPTDEQNKIIWGEIEKLKKSGKVFDTLYTGNPIAVEADSPATLRRVYDVIKRALSPEKVDMEPDYWPEMG